MSRPITEKPVLMGRQHTLVGVLAKPVASEGDNRPTIVILNTGIVHRVGHHRMFVTMSRLLASAGYSVLRFDFSGIGDSDPRAEPLSPVESCMADIRDALDFLEKDHPAKPIVLLGLCSGADHAVLYGHTDSRIAGLVLIDPTIPPTARFYLDYMLARITSLRNWISLVTLRSGLLRLWASLVLNRIRRARKSQQLTLQDLRFHPHLENSYQSSVFRKLRMLVVLTSESTRHTYPEQMFEAFPNVQFGDQLRLEVLHGSDHLFSAAADRSNLNEFVLGWLNDTCPDLSTRVLRESAA
jgi:pimeloyl-ACP methyl ester carboxylesterase